MSNIIFRNEVGPAVEVLRLSKDGIWANPEIPVDEAAQAVLAAIDLNIKLLVKKAIEAEREACAELAFNAKTYFEAAAAIRARGQP